MIPHSAAGLSPKENPARSLIHVSPFLRQGCAVVKKQFRAMAKEIPPSSASQCVSHDSIARRAYEIWQGEGCPDGRDMEHWLRALSELKAQSDRTTTRPAERPEENGTEPNKPRGARRGMTRLGEKRFNPAPPKPARAQSGDRGGRGWA